MNLIVEARKMQANIIFAGEKQTVNDVDLSSNGNDLLIG
jgi:hypothetical protein